MSQWKRRQPGITGTKDTRWDRIRKRYTSANQFTLKSDAVRRFIEMDYIGKQNEKLLIEGAKSRRQLDPKIVMDMRHEMFQKIPRKLPLATVANEKNIEPCVAHNLKVEKRYLTNELNKLRQQLEKNRKRNYLKLRESKCPKQSLQLDNSQLMQSLKSASEHIRDFYEAPIEAMEQARLIYEEAPAKTLHNNAEADVEVNADHLDWNAIKADVKSEWAEVQIMEFEAEYGVNFQKSDEQTISVMQRCRTPSPLTPTDEFFKPMRAAAERQMHRMRCVRFEENQAKSTLERQISSCSNTSDGIDSVISDLAEEAIMELQKEEEQQNQNQDGNQENTLHLNQEPKVINAATTAEIPVSEDATHLVNPLQMKQFTKTRIQLEDPLQIRRLTLPKVVVKSKTNTEEPPRPLSSCANDDEVNAAGPNNEKNRIIEKLFQARIHRDESTLREYFLKWIHFVTIEKLERNNCKLRCDRAQKINAFLDKIRKEKHRIKTSHNTNVNGNNANKMATQREEALKMAKQFKNKIKVQQDIIDLQRLKLERQERVIMQMKLNKLSEEHNEARQELKQELKSFIRCGDAKAKAKAKCLQLIGNLRDNQDEELARLQGRSMLQPKFLQNMQERAVERSIRHEQAKQRRQQAEAEREAQKIAAEEAKRLEDEEAKRLRIEALKEKRRVEKMAKILKERERQRAMENLRKAKEFHRRLILRRVGMEAFKRLLQRKRENQRKCEQLRTELYKRNYFVFWNSYAASLVEQKKIKAGNCYNYQLKRRAIIAWRMYVSSCQSKLLVAIDWHALKLSELWLQRWWRYTQHMATIEQTKMHQATSHHEWHLKWKVLDCWRRLPQILLLERETEERRQRWRLKIWELLPDYKPNREESQW